MDLTLTNHFIERYYERVLSTCGDFIPPKGFLQKNKFVKTDMKKRITNREQNIYNMLSSVSKVKVPFGKQFNIVLKDGVCVTVY